MAVMCTFLISAQNDFGIKGGFSYNSNGELKEFLNEAETIINNEGEGKSGFNIGFYGKLDMNGFYIRPELVYTKTNSKYSLNGGNDFKMSKIDVPVLVGVKLIGPLNVFAGPAFQYILKDEFNNVNYDEVKDNFTVGMNIGASIELGRFGFDARYERGLSSNEANWTNAGKNFTLDSRPEQFIFSLSYSLKKDSKK